MELALFHELEAYKRNFLTKCAENIASALSVIKINERTTNLLAIAQKQSEELKAQEEELRQNLEEMQATQEQLHRQSHETAERLRKEFEL